jgi:pimeloyl-ACP methyl ester carboxylesterase
MVLLHGVGATWRVWTPVLPLLEARHAVFAPTLPGHRGGVRLADDTTPSVQALVDGVAHELDRLGIDRAHLVGNSLGGWIALELARRGRALSVVVFGSAGAWRSRLRLAQLLMAMRLSLILLRIIAPWADQMAGRRWTRWFLLNAQVVHPDRVAPDELAEAIRASVNAPVVVPLLRTIGRHPFTHLPPEAGRPIRVVWSDKDRVLPFRPYGLPLMELLPSAELVRLPDAGHIPMSDQPEEVTRLVLEVTAAADADREEPPS